MGAQPSGDGRHESRADEWRPGCSRCRSRSNARWRRTAQAGSARSGRRRCHQGKPDAQEHHVGEEVLLADQTTVQQEREEYGEHHKCAEEKVSTRRRPILSAYRQDSTMNRANTQMEIMSMSRYSWLVKPRLPPPSPCSLVPQARDRWRACRTACRSQPQGRWPAAPDAKTCGRPRSAGT